MNRAVLLITILVVLVIIIVAAMSQARRGRYHRRGARRPPLRYESDSQSSESESSDSYQFDSPSDSSSSSSSSSISWSTPSRSDSSKSRSRSRSSSSRSSSSSSRSRRDDKKSCCRPIYIIPLFSPGINGVNIQLQVTGGTRPYTYKWSTGETTSNLVNVPYLTNIFVKVFDADLCEGEVEFSTPGSPNTNPGCPEIQDPPPPQFRKYRLFPKNL